MIVKLLTEHHLGFLSLKGGCTGSSESTLVKMSNCWTPHAAAHLICNLDTVRITTGRTPSGLLQTVSGNIFSQTGTCSNQPVIAQVVLART